MGSSIYDIPEPDKVPDNPAQLDLWDRKNSVICAEWVSFWQRVGDHERAMVAKHGDRYKGVIRDEACRAFRVKLRAKYNATDPSDAWCAYDDERRRTLNKPERTVFKTGQRAQSREHADHWGDR